VEWVVIKMGAEMFDALHAYGLAIVLASASGKAVELKDDGYAYRLSASCSAGPDACTDLLDEVLKLPTQEDIITEKQSVPDCSLPVANLDGLLAALFTTPQGIGCLSVADLLERQRVDPSSISRGLAKVSKACAKWKGRTGQKGQTTSAWLRDLLKDYDPYCPRFPQPALLSRETDITAVMTLDPSLGYAARRPHSDGLIARKTNVTVHGTCSAPLLAYIGAARFLRAQHLAGHLVNYYVPLASTLSLDAETALPLLSALEDAPDFALADQFLRYALGQTGDNTRWKALAFQTVQRTQGTHGAISRLRGCLDLVWLNTIEQHTGRAMMLFWRTLLQERRNELRDMLEPLVEALVSRRIPAWMAHLLEVTRRAHALRSRVVRLYTLDEVKEVTRIMDPSLTTPLATILERKDGTVRFGHALRSLSQYNRSAARDVLEALEKVQTRDQLVLVLGHLMQACTIAWAKWPFIPMPFDEDARNLLNDVERYSAHTIAVLLILLSSLHYPRSDDGEPPVNSAGTDASLAPQAPVTGAGSPALPIVAHEMKGDTSQHDSEGTDHHI